VTLPVTVTGFGGSASCANNGVAEHSAATKTSDFFIENIPFL
jgi:hypothetical protein